MTTILYGIANCDTVKKARAWLLEHGHDYRFHDFKKQGLERELAAAWLAQRDWETLINRKGTTWRGLPDERRAQVSDAAGALELMLQYPSVIKRPVLAGVGPLAVGFTPADYAARFGAAP
jgi:arsenate reductase (glutaredoxin)